ncbi:DUF3291 domain-containing protein [Mesorhizobium sp. LHD-90]|uniref:DUF3291 domain-containing protein n=1 Tax=Mesorhizobium sp. LHD-90 TaxID=3071414 RepID=UPI0027E07E26|nr:DUF3291 domain-containing protein [Mesorhizobium sp. LHD-90]MDQ6436681.1 DUF3291 domain-containing protein [Mesorhizobium sp. LHD-90]
MRGKSLAIYNFGMFRQRADHPSIQGFHDRNDRNFAAAEQSGGFVARSGYADEPGPPSWGRQVYPRFHVDHGDGWAPSTLSLWRDLGSLMAFSYAGFHGETLRHARDWFVEPQWPPYVLWWVEPDRMPLWAEGVARLEHLHDHGASAFAFDFKHPYDEHGHPTAIDRAALRQRKTDDRTRVD